MVRSFTHSPLSPTRLRSMESEQRGTYNMHSPTHSHYSYSHSPKNLSTRKLSSSNSATLAHPSAFGSSMVLSQPTSPTAPSLPPIRVAKHSMESSANTFYDPTTDRDARLAGRNGMQHFDAYQGQQVSIYIVWLSFGVRGFDFLMESFIDAVA